MSFRARLGRCANKTLITSLSHRLALPQRGKQTVLIVDVVDTRTGIQQQFNHVHAGESRGVNERRSIAFTWQTRIGVNFTI
jgi:hypothetical protein